MKVVRRRIRSYKAYFLLSGREMASEAKHNTLKMLGFGRIKMLFTIILAALSQLAFAEDWTQKLLFHGTSLVLRPDYSNHEAANHTATAANFYSYFGQTGYISFGWLVNTMLPEEHNLTSLGGYPRQQVQILHHAAQTTRYLSQNTVVVFSH